MALLLLYITFMKMINMRLKPILAGRFWNFFPEVESWVNKIFLQISVKLIRIFY